MKKIASFCLASIMTMAAANAAPAVKNARAAAPKATSAVTNRVMAREYQPYTVETAKGWYVGGRLALGFLNFSADSTVTTGALEEAISEQYSMETMFGGSIFAGTDFRLSNSWFRGDFEAGLMGRFEDATAGTELKLTVPYLMANAYYDLSNGLYVGVGAGVAMPKIELDGPDFIEGESKKTSFAPMVGAMLGWSYDLDSRVSLDLRYRIAGFTGSEIERIAEVAGVESDVKTSLSFVLENSLSMGLRYRF